MKYIFITCIFISVLLAENLAEKLKKHVVMMAETIGERNSFKYESLQKTSEYIQACLDASSFDKKNHHYNIADKKYTNVVYEKHGSGSVILIGAHYDTAWGTPGADDNATGVAVLLEVAKQLTKYENNHTIRFVFFTLEEPPFFRTENMGSTRYAKYLKDNNEKIELMICLEMLGFYSEQKIQTYPNPILGQIYPEEANYVAIVSNEENKKIATKFYQSFSQNLDFSSQILIAPPSLTGVDFSDHLSFWKYNYPALMLTDTSFYRNKNYHEETDTPDTLDYQKMADISNVLVKTIQSMDQEE